MRIAVTGASGLLGGALVQRLRASECEVVAYGRSMDVSVDACAHLTRSFDVCIHCAAIADVARCEAQPYEAWHVNVAGSRNVAHACRRNGIRLVYISTDFVFEGRADKWYDESAQPRPLQVYGRTKAAAEQEVRIVAGTLIIRLPLLFGVGPRTTWLATAAEALLAGRQIEADDREIRQPALTDDIAVTIAALINRDVTGIVHVAPQATTTKRKWAQHVATLLKADPDCVLPRPANAGGPPRPLHACLATHRLMRLGVPSPRSYETTTRLLLQSLGLMGI